MPACPSAHTIRHFATRIVRAPLTLIRHTRRVETLARASSPLADNSASILPLFVDGHHDDSQGKLGKNKTLIADLLIFIAVVALLLFAAIYVFSPTTQATNSDQAETGKDTQSTHTNRSLRCCGMSNQ